MHFQHNSKTKRRQGQHIESWDGDRFLIQSMYLNTKHKRGCSPVLKIQFMSGESRENQNCYNAGKQVTYGNRKNFEYNCLTKIIE